MGKAIICRGIEVNKPLCKITIFNSEADKLLADYYATNSTISDVEKDALNTFVNGLVDNGLWDKMSYFYPMLGSTVQDQLIEAISPGTDDIFASVDQSRLSIDNRKLLVGIGTSGPNTSIQRAKSLDLNDIGIISAFKRENSISQNFKTISLLPIDKTVGVAMTGTERDIFYPHFNALNGEEDLPLPPLSEASNEQNYTERVLFGSVKNNTASFYCENTIRKKVENVINTSYSVGRTSNILTNASSSGTYKIPTYFNAITKGMTDANWQAMYPLIIAFLRAVGKVA